MQFDGFKPEALKFLRDLEHNKNKEWFESRRHEYEALILTPLRKLVMDLSPAMSDIDPYLELRPVVNKTISRIYRDTRFSKDKRLFRNHMWITFKQPRLNWYDMPSWWFEIMPTGYTFGMGFYQASPETMHTFRKMISTDLSGFRKTISFYPGKPAFELEGAVYKRSMTNDLPDDIQSWYQKRNMYLICKRPEEKILYSPKLVDELAQRYLELEPLYQYWMQASQK